MRLQGGKELRAADSFRADQEHPVFAGLHRCDQNHENKYTPTPHVQFRRHTTCPNIVQNLHGIPGTLAGPQHRRPETGMHLACLVLHQGNQWRNDQCQAREYESRKLVAQRLARACICCVCVVCGWGQGRPGRGRQDLSQSFC